MSQFDEKTLELLVDIEQMLREENIAAVLKKKGEEDYTFSMLSALIENMSFEGMDGLGEFFFMPEKEGLSEIGIFQSVITFAEDVDADTLEKLNQVASILNFYMESGSFSGDCEGRNFTFKTSVVLPLDGDMETLKSIVELNAGQAIIAATSFADVFRKVVVGTMSIDEIRELVSPKE